MTCVSTGQTTHHLRLPLDKVDIGARFLRHPSYNTTNRDYGPQAQSFARLCPSFPVTPDPSVDIAIIEFRAVDPLRRDEILVLSVSQLLKLHRDRLQHTSVSANALDQPLTNPLVLEWENWGLSMTRWIPSGLKKGSGSCVFGSKLVAVGPPHVFEKPTKVEGSQADQNMHLILFDFNPRSFLRLKDGIDPESGRGRALVTDASPWSPVGCRDILYDVKSGLAFRAIISEYPSTYKSVYLDGNGLVCRNVRSSD